MNHLTDQEIIANVLAGDTAAYSVLVNRYGSKVFTLAYNIVVNREDAEEVAQDAFVKAFSALGSFKQQSSFSTWLYRIVVNTALNKKKLRKWVVADATETLTSENYDNLHSWLQQFAGNDQKKFIQAAMRSLRDDERICITMYYFYELPVNEIHELTAITIANIKVLLHRGRKHLYDKLNTLLKTEIKSLL